MARLAITALSLTLGLLFIFIGLLKLTPAINESLHKEMKQQFKECRSVFPFYKQTGWRPKTSEYRRAVGTFELVCGLVLAFIPGRIKTLANLLLMCLMAGSLYTHWALDHHANKMTGALIFLLLLTCRFVINMQHQATPEVETAKQHKKTE